MRGACAGVLGCAVSVRRAGEPRARGVRGGGGVAVAFFFCCEEQRERVRLG